MELELETETLLTTMSGQLRDDRVRSGDSEWYFSLMKSHLSEGYLKGKRKFTIAISCQILERFFIPFP